MILVLFDVYYFVFRLVYLYNVIKALRTVYYVAITTYEYRDFYIY